MSENLLSWGALLTVREHKRAIGGVDKILHLDIVGGFTDVYIFTSSYKLIICALHGT